MSERERERERERKERKKEARAWMVSPQSVLGKDDADQVVVTATWRQAPSDRQC